MKQQNKQLTIVNEAAIAGWLKENQSKLQSYGGKNFDIQEFLRSAMLVIMDSMKLREALKTPQGKEKLYNALKYGASIGLSLNPLKGHACLIPYEGKSGLKIDYQIMKEGLIQLALDSGKVEYITADIVKEGDKFEISKTGNGDDYIFKPALKDRGKIIGFFAYLKTISGIGHLKYMTKLEVNEIRDTYSKSYAKNKDTSPWTTSYPGQGLKTVIKALFRIIKISPDMKKAISTDDYFDFEDTEPRNVTPGITPQDVKEKITQPPEKQEKKEDPKKTDQPKKSDLF